MMRTVFQRTRSSRDAHHSSAVASTTIAAHEVRMAAGQQHADRAAHRVADGDHRRDAERFEQQRPRRRRHPPGRTAVCRRSPRPWPRWSMVMNENCVAKRLVGGEELQVGARRPAVQQQHDRRVGIGVPVEAVEELAAAGHDQCAALGQPRDHGVGRCVAHEAKRYRDARLPGRRSGDAGELLQVHTQVDGSSQGAPADRVIGTADDVHARLDGDRRDTPRCMPP